MRKWRNKGEIKEKKRRKRGEKEEKKRRKKEKRGEKLSRLSHDVNSHSINLIVGLLVYYMEATLRCYLHL